MYKHPRNPRKKSFIIRSPKRTSASPNHKINKYDLQMRSQPNRPSIILQFPPLIPLTISIPSLKLKFHQKIALLPNSLNPRNYP